MKKVGLFRQAFKDLFHALPILLERGSTLGGEVERGVRFLV
jgi:hypothetical protein